MSLTEQVLALTLFVAVPSLALESFPSRLHRHSTLNRTSNATFPPLTVGTSDPRNLTAANSTGRSFGSPAAIVSEPGIVGWKDCQGRGPAGAADCDMPDLGSCGSACCTVEVGIDAAPDEAYASLSSFFTTNQFASVNTYQQIRGVQENLSSLPTDVVGSLKFFVQGIHLTSKRSYSHSLEFTIRAAKRGKSSILRGFSISNMHGALEDEGENGKVLLALLDSIGAGSKVNTLYGCGKAPKPWRKGHALVPRPTPRSQGSSSCRGGGEALVKVNGKLVIKEDPDCGRPDLGSCGTACCALEVVLAGPAGDDAEGAADGGGGAAAAAPEGLYRRLAALLDAGGDRGSFERDHGKAYFNGHPPENLTSLGMEWKYLVKGKHTSSEISETLSFNIRSGDSGTSILRGFSISEGSTAEAISDAGQNYKNLVYVFDGLGVPREPIRLLHGCGLPSAANGGGPQALALILSGFLALAAHLGW